MVQESHPLQQFFLEMVGRHYAEEIGLRDPQVIGYVAHLLTEFCDAEQLFKIRIGDYTLFFAGMFPESINHFRLRRQRMESFVDLMKAGKESYYIVSKFEYFEYAKVAPLFAQLSNRFEQCVFGLNRVKNELQEMQHPVVRRTQELLM